MSRLLSRNQVKYYLMTGIHVHRGRIRLLQTNNRGKYLYDENGNTIKRDMKINKFEEQARVVKVIEEV